MGKILLVVAFILSSCSSVLKGQKRHVEFIKGPESGVTKILAPEGEFKIKGGSGELSFEVSEQKTPLEIRCSNGKVSKTFLSPEEGQSAWGAGAFVAIPVSSTREIVDLSKFCGQVSQRNVASGTDGQ